MQSRHLCRPAGLPCLRAALIALLGVIGPGLGLAAPGPGSAGEPAEQIQVDVVSARDLKQLRESSPGKVQLVNFWATWCGPCVDEFPDLVELSRRYESDGLQLVTVSANSPDERPQVLAFLQRFNPPSRNLLFGSTDLYTMLKSFDSGWVETIPYTALVDRKGRIVFRREGRIDKAELEAEISRALVCPLSLRHEVG
jgi:thiol-disulfide isomerase/thioredoxin